MAHSACLRGCSRVSSLEKRLCRDSSLSVTPSGYPIFMRIHESLLLFMRWAGLFGIWARFDTHPDSSCDSWLRGWRPTPSLIP